MTWLERHKARERHAMWVYSGATALLVLLALFVLLTESVTSRLVHGVIA